MNDSVFNFVFRFSLSILNVGKIETNETFVKGCSFHDGFNTGLGVFGSDNVAIEDNVFHHVVGSGIRNHGSGNRLLRNLVVLAIAPHTFKGQIPPFDNFWPGAIEVAKATNTTMVGNAVAGSEKIGFLIAGEDCKVVNKLTDFNDNEAHSCLHGLHIPYRGHRPGCVRVSNFFSWKHYDYGIFAWPNADVLVSHCTFADSVNNIFLNSALPPALSHRRVDKVVEVTDTLVVGVSPSYDCTADKVRPMPATIVGSSRGQFTKTGMSYELYALHAICCTELNSV